MKPFQCQKEFNFSVPRLRHLILKRHSSIKILQERNSYK